MWSSVLFATEPGLIAESTMDEALKVFTLGEAQHELHLQL